MKCTSKVVSNFWAALHFSQSRGFFSPALIRNVFTATVEKRPVKYTFGKKELFKKDEMITVSFKAKVLTKPGEFCRLNAGILQFDAKGRRICSVHVNPVENSDTVLLKPAVKGTREIVVKNGAWVLQKGRTMVAVFNTRPDRSDLPDFSESEQPSFLSGLKKCLSTCIL